MTYRLPMLAAFLYAVLVCAVGYDLIALLCPMLEATS